MIYARIDEQEDNTYKVYLTEAAYDLLQPLIDGSQFFSYFTIYYRLFGLLPQDFYHYISATYHALYKPSTVVNSVIHMFFPTRADAMAFANEFERRLKYCVKRGDFT